MIGQTSFLKPSFATRPWRPRFKGSALAKAEPGSTWHDYAAPEVMVKEVQRQRASIHGLPFSTDAQDAAYTDWGEEPFGRGWNNWSIGVKSWEVKEQIIQPFAGNSHLLVKGIIRISP